MASTIKELEQENMRLQGLLCPPAENVEEEAAEDGEDKQLVMDEDQLIYD